jgi:hypothetical protein
MAYYADEERARDAVDRILELLEEHDAIGLFHVAEEVHDEEILAGYRDRIEGVITLTEDGHVDAAFD